MAWVSSGTDHPVAQIEIEILLSQLIHQGQTCQLFFLMTPNLFAELDREIKSQKSVQRCSLTVWAYKSILVSCLLFQGEADLRIYQPY